MLNLQSGQQWRTRGGAVVTIGEMIGGPQHFWSCSNGLYVDEDGNTDSLKETDHDLVALVEPEEQKE